MSKAYVVASSNTDTSLAAAKILDNGGNAYDAVLAALFTSFVSEPLLSSPGGGGYLLAKPFADEPQLIDFFPQTPKNKVSKGLDFFPISGDFGESQQEFHIGLAAAAVPGVFSGVQQIHKTYSSLPLEKLVENAVEKARNGVKVDKNLEQVIQILQPIIKQSETAKALFSTESNLLKQGDIFKNPVLGEFLLEFAQSPADWFYNSKYSKSICDDMKKSGGFLELNDFLEYKTIQRDPLHSEFGEWQFYSNSPPARGGSCIQKQLEYALNADQACTVNIIKAMQKIEPLNSGHINTLESTKGTSHISIIDKQGNAASLTISNGEGCGYMVDGAGFMLNNFLGEEDINPNGFHQWTENKRMISMMSPCLLENNDSIFALGTGGSNRIKTSLFQVIYALIKDQKTIVDAVNQPRMHFEKGILDVENGLTQTVLNQIEGLKLNTNLWTKRSLYFGGVNAVQFGANNIAVADSRRSGMSIVSM